MNTAMIEKLKNYLQLDPDDIFTKFALALEYRKAGDLQRTLVLLEEIHEQNPDYVGTYYHLGKLYDQLNNNQKAIVIYKEGIQIATDANDQTALSELKSALMELEVNDE